MTYSLDYLNYMVIERLQKKYERPGSCKGKGFPNNPAIIQDVRITGKESIAALRSKENHFFFPLKYCNGWVWL